MNAPDAFALGGTDPLVALWAEHLRVRARRDACPDSVEGDDECDRLGDGLSKIEDQMDALVPASLAGAVALVRLLRFYDEIGHSDGDVLANLLAGLERIADDVQP
jgi:hypothetical protein